MTDRPAITDEELAELRRVLSPRADNYEFIAALITRLDAAEDRLKFVIPVPDGFVTELGALLDEDEAMDVVLLIEKYGVCQP